MMLSDVVYAFRIMRRAPLFATAVVFVVVASFYKGRTYLQSQGLTPDERATEPILAGGSPT